MADKTNPRLRPEFDTHVAVGFVAPASFVTVTVTTVNVSLNQFDALSARFAVTPARFVAGH